MNKKNYGSYLSYCTCLKSHDILHIFVSQSEMRRQLLKKPPSPAIGSFYVLNLSARPIVTIEPDAYIRLDHVRGKSVPYSFRTFILPWAIKGIEGIRY